MDTVTNKDEVSQSNLIEKLGQKYSPLLKYMDSIDGTFGCRDRYEKSISLDPTALAGHYSMLCDQAISLILPEILNSLRVHKP